VAQHQTPPCSLKLWEPQSGLHRGPEVADTFATAVWGKCTYGKVLEQQVQMTDLAAQSSRLPGTGPEQLFS